MGLLSSIAVYATEPSLPTPPGYAIRVAVAPGPQPSPVRVEVCATTGSPNAGGVPGPGRLVEISIDGQNFGKRRPGRPKLLITLFEHLAQPAGRSFVPSLFELVREERGIVTDLVYIETKGSVYDTK